MKKAVIFLVIGIFFVFVTSYLTSVTSPFDLEKIQELSKVKEMNPNDWESLANELNTIIKKGLVFDYLSQSAYLVAGLVLCSIFFFFVAIHLFTDKFFFKNFYEDPSLFDAIRRGILFCVGIFLLVLMNLYAVSEEYYLAIVPTFIILLDFVFTKYFKASLVEKIRQINELQIQKRKERQEKLVTKY